LTDAAEADLRSIIRYTRRQWGADQVRKYTAALAHAMDRTARGEGQFRELDDIHQGLRVCHCQRHYIFCLMRSELPMLVVAILHERMDLVARLESRLK
jgi:toxin ParE1/3/4